MKFESSTSTDLGESSDLHDSNGTNSGNVKNGIIKEATNGVSSTFVGNGAVKNGSQLSDQFYGHSREEVTRLMIQALNDLGYT
jgi:WD repeat-containing protein 26